MLGPSLRMRRKLEYPLGSDSSFSARLCEDCGGGFHDEPRVSFSFQILLTLYFASKF